MQVRDSVASVAGFDALPPSEQVKLFGWFLHAHRRAERFNNESIRACFREADMPGPDVSVYLPRLANKKPPEVLKDSQGYRLAGNIRRAYDAKYGEHPTTVVVRTMLAALPSKVPNVAEREFLAEALNCYRVGAFRAAIVMTWNLAYDHLTRWILDNPTRLADFNTAIGKKYQKKSERIATLTDYEHFREAEILEVLRTSGLAPKNVVDILDEKLKKRNAAAHPSQVTISQPLADAVIIDLIDNVVLFLK
ncbi:MAG TPA: hypothetical protein VIP11_19240 [Gemmatimonadaceae bacterium]